MLVNTGRGALIDTPAVIDGLSRARSDRSRSTSTRRRRTLFFEDRSGEIIADDVFARLLTFPNVLITAHQGFLTRRRSTRSPMTTLDNLDSLAAGEPCPNRLV